MSLEKNKPQAFLQACEAMIQQYAENTPSFCTDTLSIRFIEYPRDHAAMHVIGDTDWDETPMEIFGQDHPDHKKLLNPQQIVGYY